MNALAWFFLSLHGRVSRQEFWLGYVGIVVVALILDSFFSLSAFCPAAAGRIASAKIRSSARATRRRPATAEDAARPLQAKA